MSQIIQHSPLKALLQSRKTTPSNPAQYFLEWKPRVGKFEYYDKELQQKVIVDKIEGLALFVHFVLRGWDKDGSALISNEVKNPAQQPFTVCKYSTDNNGNKQVEDVVTGIWRTDIKGKYPVDIYQSMYLTATIHNELALVNLRIGKSGLSDLIKAKIKPEDLFVLHFQTGTLQSTKIAKWYSLQVSKTTDNFAVYETLAIQHYRLLTDYFKEYFAVGVQTQEPEVDVATGLEPIDVVFTDDSDQPKVIFNS